MKSSNMKAAWVVMTIVVIGAFLFYERQAFRQGPVGIFQQNNQPATTPQTLTPIVEEASVNSPDGSMNLTMRTSQRDVKITYTFLVTDKKGDKERQIYATSRDASHIISLSPNTWSPDGTYLYIVEPDPMRILVFKSSGEPFRDGNQYIDIVELFQKNKPGYTITQVTGWMSPTIIQIATLTDKQEKGPYYWFVVPTSAFLIRS